MTGIFVMAAGALLLAPCAAIWWSGKYLTPKQDRWFEYVLFVGCATVWIGVLMTIKHIAILEGWWT